MNKKAEAFAQYNEAAVLQMLIEVLPKLAAEVAAPLASIDKLTVISTDGAGALPKQVTNNVVQTLELLKNTTGIDLESLMQSYAGGVGPRPAAVVPPAAPDGSTVN
jgi:flotillin